MRRKRNKEERGDLSDLNQQRGLVREESNTWLHRDWMGSLLEEQRFLSLFLHFFFLLEQDSAVLGEVMIRDEQESKRKGMLFRISRYTYGVGNEMSPFTMKNDSVFASLCSLSPGKYPTKQSHAQLERNPAKRGPKKSKKIQKINTRRPTA